MKHAAFLLALLLPAVATAQTTTSCGWEMGRWVCHSSTPQAPIDYVGNAMRAQEQGRAQVQAIFDARNARDQAAQAEQDRIDAQRHALAQAESEKSFNAQVAQFVLDGQCDKAKSYALAAGRLDVADLTMRVCTPAK